jgi:hypothetical protein
MDVKQCNSCGEFKYLSEYSPDKTISGLRGQCKTCQYVVQSNRYYAEKYKPQAKEKARQAYKKGKLQKPLFCENCHEDKPLDKHHPDYRKPLKVEWLCRKCHRLAG